MSDMLLLRRRIMMAQKRHRTYEWHAGQPLPNWIVPYERVGTTVIVDDGGVTIDSNRASSWSTAGIDLFEPLKAELLSLSQFSITYGYTNAYSPGSNTSINFSTYRNSYIFSNYGFDATTIKNSAAVNISNIWGKFTATDGNLTIISNRDGVNEYYKDGVLKYTDTKGGFNSSHLCWVQQGKYPNDHAYMTITNITIKA